MKRQIQKLLVCAVLFSAVTLAQAQFNYTNNGDGTCTITNYTGSGGDVTIPDTIDGLMVTGIGGNAFGYNATITSMTIPDSITNIGSGAFYYCTSLTNASIGNSVISIGNVAFAWCSNLTSITIPNSVIGIGGAAFEQCSSLSSVTIGDGVTSIGDYAFDWCTSLTSVIIPDGVTSIGYSAFFNCYSLTNLTIGNGVTSIEVAAFQHCTNLTSITIGNSVTNIGDVAFMYCYSLTSAYFLGNAPNDTGDGFLGDTNIVYYLPGATGWSPTFGGRPTQLWNPQATAFSVTDSNFGFNITGPSNTVIVVEACANPADPVWLSVSTNALDASGASSFSDSQSGSYSARFYRFRSP